MALNDIALVTGARGGIGRALVARLRARGLRVAAVGRDAAALAELPADALTARIAADSRKISLIPGTTETTRKSTTAVPKTAISRG